MSKEKKTAEIKEEIKNSAQLTDEQMAEVSGGIAATDMMLVQAANPEVALAERMAAPAEFQTAALAN